MFAEVLRYALYALAFRVVASIVKKIVVPSPLANIRGPPSSGSWLWGALRIVSGSAGRLRTLIFVLGHFKQLFDRQSWQFQNELYNKYGQIVTADALLGVRHFRALHGTQTAPTDQYSENYCSYSTR